MADKKTAQILPVLFAASGLGAPDKRCGIGPEHVAEMLAKHAIPGLDCLPVLMPTSGEGLVVLSAFLQRLSQTVSHHLHDRMMVVSGDHSCAIGTWQGVHRKISPLGLIWVDAHMDAHTPSSSPSGYWHGMPVACLLGHGEPSLVAAGVAVRPENLCLVGVRSFESSESQLLLDLGVRVLTIQDVQRMGFSAAMAEARSVASQGTAGYGLSLDLDGLDLADAPAVGSPVVGGIAADELLQALSLLCLDPQFKVFEVSEFNPINDVDQRTLLLLLKMLRIMAGGNHEP